MRPILGIDPGTVQSGWCWYQGGTVVQSGTWPNEEILDLVADQLPAIAIERFEARGMAVGDDSIETVIWTGRFIQATGRPEQVILVKRSEVKLLLCGTNRARDPNVRQALIDLIGPPGTAKKPGPTHGVSGNAWAALGVAVTANVQLSEAL